MFNTRVKKALHTLECAGYFCLNDLQPTDVEKLKYSNNLLRIIQIHHFNNRIYLSL